MNLDSDDQVKPPNDFSRAERVPSDTIVNDLLKSDIEAYRALGQS